MVRWLCATPGCSDGFPNDSLVFFAFGLVFRFGVPLPGLRLALHQICPQFGSQAGLAIRFAIISLFVRFIRHRSLWISGRYVGRDIGNYTARFCRQEGDGIWDQTNLQHGLRCARRRPIHASRCRSSGVEHSLGKGEVESSNLSGSTSKPVENKGIAGTPAPRTPASVGRTKKELPEKSGENPGTLFTERSPGNSECVDPPVWGSSGRSHQAKAAIKEAALRLVATPCQLRPCPLVPHLKTAFGLTTVEAVEAIGVSQLFRANGTI